MYPGPRRRWRHVPSHHQEAHSVATSDDGVDRRQFLFVSICLVGLVLAAFLAPVSGENDPVGIDGDGSGSVTDLPGTPSGDGDGQQPGDGGGDPPTGWIPELFEWLSGDGERKGGPSRCQVYVESNPTPGRPTSVMVTVDREPASGTRVWFNDEFVGQTDDRGLVTADAPYARELNVTVESPIDERCAFSRRTAVGQPRVGTTPPAVAAPPDG